MQGTLQPGSIPHLLGEMFARGRSGVLRLDRNGHSVAIHLQEGRIAGVEAAPGRGQRPPEAPAALAGSVEKRLGTMLRDLGISVRGQAALDRAALMGALSWHEGRYAFEEQLGGLEAEAGALDLDMPELIRESVRRSDDPAIQQALGDPESPLSQAHGDRRPLDLTPCEEALLALVDGTRTIREVLQAHTATPAEARGSLLGLLCMGVVERLARAEEPPPAPEEELPAADVDAPVFVDDTATAIRRREINEAVLHLLQADHFQALGISRQAGERQIKDAYLQRVKQFHPDRHADPGLADLKQKLEALLIRMGEAYEVLRDSGRRARYVAELDTRASALSGRVLTLSSSGAGPASVDEPGDDSMAEQAIRQADQLVSESRYFDAIQVLEGAIPWIQSMGLKHAAQVRLARVYARNPHWVRRSETLLHGVVREDPSRIDAYFALGIIYRESGLRTRALAMFRKVLDLSPKHGPALAQVRALEKPAPSGNLLGRL